MVLFLSPHIPLIVKAGFVEPPISNAPFKLPSNLPSKAGWKPKIDYGPLTEYHALFASK